MDSSVLLALFVTAGAGAMTALGAVLSLLGKTTNRGFLALALGFSAGVMIYVSFVEIVPKSTSFFSSSAAEGLDKGLMAAFFLAGLAGMALLYRVVPELHHPDQEKSAGTPGGDVDPMLLRAGLGVAIAITVHNFPEGLATFFLTLDDPQIGIPVAIAIAIHNIPEGIAVAVPIYFATKKKSTALGFGVVASVAEPLGALLGWVFLGPIMTDSVLGGLFAIVAGIMVYISIDGLLPSARQYGDGHRAIYGMITGMAVMALSLVLFRL